jgi:hypothetical protein
MQEWEYDAPICQTGLRLPGLASQEDNLGGLQADLKGWSGAAEPSR